MEAAQLECRGQKLSSRLRNAHFFPHFAEIEIESGRTGDWGQLGKDVSTAAVSEEGGAAV